jgi:hypothetical protein
MKAIIVRQALGDECSGGAYQADHRERSYLPGKQL